MKSPAQRYFEQFKSELSVLHDVALIMRFNKEIGNPAWGAARASFLAAMHKELDRRGIDYSNIGDDDCLTLNHHVVLTEDRQLVTIAN